MLPSLRPSTLPLLGVCGLLVSAKAEESWKQIVATHCLECHDADSEKGGIDLDSILDEDIASSAGTWENVVRQMQARQMPPIGKDRPSAEEYDATVASLISTLDAISPRDPGRTDTLRRLTRHEYRNAIRDLLGLEIEIENLLPADEVSHGFDNITVGDLSPALLEKYIGAAQKISRLAVGISPSAPDGRTVRLAPDLTQEDHVEGLPLGTRGGVLLRHHFPRSGEYEVQVRLTRDRNEKIEGLGGTHEMEILLNSEVQETIVLRPPRNQDHSTYDANLRTRFRVDGGTQELGVTFVKKIAPVEETLRQPYLSHFNVHRHPRLSPAIYEVTVLGPFTDEGIGETEPRKRLLQVSPKGKNPSMEEAETAARENLAPLMRRAYRRSVDENDFARVLPFFREAWEESQSFDRGMEAALSAILVSRDFLFRIETDPTGITPGDTYPLDDFSLASRLAFFLWSSLPDEELLALAEAGQLKDPKILRQQARRMLTDERSQSLVTNFAHQWLYLRNLEAITPDGRLYPDFDDNLRKALRRETELLFETVLREDRNVLALLENETTFLNERLAKHYGIPHVYGPRFRPVALSPEHQRGGLLRQGSILTVTSYATRTSPVIRGAWILENLLGTPPPPPPPNVPALEDNSVSADLPIRERFAAHREKAACASCHNVIDPIGFALENYDAVGRWQDVVDGEPVDARGGWADGREFVGVAGLEDAILEKPEFFVRTLAEKLLTYALGRGVEPSDAPAIREVVREASTGEYEFSKIITAIVTSDPFTKRRAADQSTAAR
ncbi:MAG: DUF1592 domain-containing protein [Verrucomicrobiales bacterium]|nr:DUF1592 domain-containing protein [Verrucomicrobiales bacterium]